MTGINFGKTPFGSYSAFKGKIDKAEDQAKDKVKGKVIDEVKEYPQMDNSKDLPNNKKEKRPDEVKEYPQMDYSKDLSNNKKEKRPDEAPPLPPHDEKRQNCFEIASVLPLETLQAYSGVKPSTSPEARVTRHLGTAPDDDSKVRGWLFANGAKVGDTLKMRGNVYIVDKIFVDNDGTVRFQFLRLND